VGVAVVETTRTTTPTPLPNPPPQGGREQTELVALLCVNFTGTRACWPRGPAGVAQRKSIKANLPGGGGFETRPYLWPFS
jgi:hypothetical protein